MIKRLVVALGFALLVLAGASLFSLRIVATPAQNPGPVMDVLTGMVISVLIISTSRVAGAAILWAAQEPKNCET